MESYSKILGIIPVAHAEGLLLSDLINDLFLKILDDLVIFFIGVAVVVFMWGVIRFVGAGSDVERRQKGKQVMLWGIIALFVMVSISGILLLIDEFFGLDIKSQTEPRSDPYNIIEGLVEVDPAEVDPLEECPLEYRKDTSIPPDGIPDTCDPG